MKMLDLFSGIGGISLAADWAGIETIAFCEIEPFCQKVLHKHWPDVPIFDDVKTLTKESLQERGVEVGAIELISAGYPCQPFSVAGKREGENDDRHLWPEVNRLLKEIRPNWFIGENVAGHVTLGLDQVLSDLESNKYTWRSFIIPAVAINAPHRRDRIFTVAHTNCKGLERLWESEEVSRNVSQKTITECSFNGSIPIWDENESEILRMVDGFSNRVDRIKSLGNAVVPQQIYPILKAIVDIEKGCKYENMPKPKLS